MKKHSKLSTLCVWALVLCMSVGLMSGCGSSVEETETPAETTAYDAELAEAREAMDKVMNADAAEAMDLSTSYDVEQCIWVDDGYQNITLEKADLEVYDEDVDYEAGNLCEQCAEETEITDRAAQSGDTVVIDFEGTEDGKTICKETNYELELGAGDVNEQFEAAIIGAETDDVVTTSITYSEDSEEELAGKTVDYTVRIRQIKEVTIPELTDELVKEHTEYDSIASYKAGVKEKLEKEYVMDAIDGWLSENSVLMAIPSSLKEKYQEELVAYYSYVAEYYYNTDIDTVYANAGYDSEADMLEDNEDSIEDSIQNELIYAYVVKEQNITSTMGDYQAYLESLASERNCSEVSELLMLYSEEDLEQQYVQYLADNWIYERSTIE